MDVADCDAHICKDCAESSQDHAMKLQAWWGASLVQGRAPVQRRAAVRPPPHVAKFITVAYQDQQ